jgi:hypothetical protein
MITMARVKFAQKRSISTLWESTFFVEQRQHAQFALDKIETLGVVNPVNFSPIDTLSVVLKLFQ